MSAIPQSEWKWFGSAGHFICGNSCRFHLCTLVGRYVISTVGEYFPHHRADAEKPETVGWDRLYETMVFEAGEPCTSEVAHCGKCGLPGHDGQDLEMRRYNTAREPREGHMDMCATWATESSQSRERSEA